MNNTKTIFKSLLIMIVAISLFTVSCSKDEGGTKNPVNPAKPITITGASITDAFTGLGTITIGGQDFDFSTFDGSDKTTTITGKANSNYVGISTKVDLTAKIALISVSGATVSGASENFKVDSGGAAITITITITPTTGNSFAAENDLKPYTKTGDNVEVTLTLKPTGDWRAS